MSSSNNNSSQLKKQEQVRKDILECVKKVISHALTCPDAATSLAIIKNFLKDNGIERELEVFDFLNPNLSPVQQNQIKSKECDTIVLDIVPSNIQDIASQVKLVVDHHESNLKFLLGLEEKIIIITHENTDRKNQEYDDLPNASTCLLLYETLYGRDAHLPAIIVAANHHDVGNFTTLVTYFKALFDEQCKSKTQVDFCQSMLKNDHDFTNWVMDEGKRLHDEKQANIQRDVNNTQLQTVRCLTNDVFFKILTGPTHFSLVSEVAKSAFDRYPGVDFSAHFMHKNENGIAKTQYFFRSSPAGKSLLEIYPLLPGAGGSPFAGGVILDGTFNGLPESLFQLVVDSDIVLAKQVSTEVVPVNLNA